MANFIQSLEDKKEGMANKDLFKDMPSRTSNMKFLKKASQKTLELQISEIDSLIKHSTS